MRRHAQVLAAMVVLAAGLASCRQRPTEPVLPDVGTTDLPTRSPSERGLPGESTGVPGAAVERPPTTSTTVRPRR